MECKTDISDKASYAPWCSFHDYVKCGTSNNCEWQHCEQMRVCRHVRCRPCDGPYTAESGRVVNSSKKRRKDSVRCFGKQFMNVIDVSRTRIIVTQATCKVNLRLCVSKYFGAGGCCVLVAYLNRNQPGAIVLTPHSRGYYRHNTPML